MQVRCARNVGVVLLLALTAGCGSTVEPRAVEQVAADDTEADEDVERSVTAADDEPSPTPSPTVQEPTNARPTAAPVQDDASGEDAAADRPAGVLSSCTPAGDAPDPVVEPTGPRPDVQRMEASLESNPDLRFFLADLEEQGVSRADALHEVYAQVVGDAFVAHARSLPGYLSAAYASPLEREPFRLAFSGPLPSELDTTSYELGSYGLEVTTGMDRLPEEHIQAGYAAAEAVGIRVLSGSYDDLLGTVRIDVIDATPEQVAAWEARLDDPSRWCMVRAQPDTPCDEAVVAAAREEAERQGEVITGGTESPEAAEAVRRSHLGLQVDESREKADREERGWRIVTEDGVGLAVTADGRPGRLNVTSCLGVVVDAHVEGVDEG